MNDEQITALFFQRSETAIAQAQEKYGKLCFSVAKNILPDTRDAEECVNDACLRAWNAIPPEHPRSLGAYLARITRNLALDRYTYNSAAKRNTALTSAFEELEDSLPDLRNGVEDHMEQQEFRHFINHFLKAQTKENRIFFIRRYWYGESISDISSACGVSEEKVKSSLFRTRTRLRTAMKKEELLYESKTL
ncbi:MAG: RNA polymerase sigma factor [Lachnospiraceae bacterium]